MYAVIIQNKIVIGKDGRPLIYADELDAIRESLRINNYSRNKTDVTFVEVTVR